MASSRYVNVSKYKNYNIPDGYNLVPAVDPRWRESEMRLAIVLESVDSQDLRQGTLYLRSDNSSVTSVALSNVLRHAHTFCTKAGGEVPDSLALAVVNWNAAKTYHLDNNAVHSFHSSFTTRVQSILEDLEPTHVLVCGDLAARNLLPGIANLDHKRGWVFRKKGMKWTVTLNIENLVSGSESDDEDASEDFDVESSAADIKDKYKKADLLYYVSRNVANLLAGRHLFSVKDCVPNPVYVNTIEKFDKLFKLLRDPANTRIALDSETRTLESYDNNIYFIQFAFSSKKGFVVPIEHPRSPFSKQEQQYIKKKLRQLFAERDKDKLKTFLVLNGAFDFRVLRSQLRIPVIHHYVHEITAGESLIDENLGIFTRVSLRTGRLESRENLQAILTSYGNDWYFTAPFSKGERNTTGLQEPDDPDVLRYCLPRGELVATPVGTIPIEQLRSGDIVLSFDEQDQKVVEAVVGKTSVHLSDRRLLRLTFASGQVVVTEDHPIWVKELNDYVPAGKLLIGSTLGLVQKSNSLLSSQSTCFGRSEQNAALIAHNQEKSSVLRDARKFVLELFPKIRAAFVKPESVGRLNLHQNRR